MDPDGTNGRHRACSARDWLRFWKRIFDLYGSFEIDVVGGEPFLYPGFVPLIRRVSAWHRLTLTSNLSWDVRKAAGLDPARVALHPSFHPDFVGIGRFIGKVLALRRRGFKSHAIVVAYPPLFRRLPGFRRRLERAGIPCWVAPYQGVYAGRQYPAAFTREQKDWLHGTHPGEPKRAFEFGVQEASPRGRLCGSGMRYFRAYPDGWVYRCISAKDSPRAKPLGHIKDAGFALASEALPCKAERCCSPLEYRNLSGP
jgi:MoaA/NifB/PqqE/SkfB family radical SAM enzyme